MGIMMHLSHPLTESSIGLDLNLAAKGSDHTFNGEGAIHRYQKDIPLFSGQIKDLTNVGLDLQETVPKIFSAMMSRFLGVWPKSQIPSSQKTLCAEDDDPTTKRY